MVAIVSGNTLGLLGGSSATLGQQGTFGNAAIGKSNEQGYLNVSNGNVVMQQRDDFIASKGSDFSLIRTYNAQGALGQHWKFGLSREVGAVTGTLNEAGSTVVRTAGDGSEALYHFDAARGVYLSTDGGGAHDSLVYDATSQSWTWQAGSGGAREVYDGQQHGRIISSSDDSGTGLSYFYDASSGLLSSVVNASGDTSWFDYTDGDLAQVRDVLVSGEVVTRVRYAYDGQHRLTAVTTDLTPADNNVDDGNVAVTSYTYDGGSERVASVTQADGSALLFSYQQVGSEWRVASVTDGLGRRTELAYDLAANTTRVTDALGAVTTYAHDAQGQLVGVTNPAGQQTSYAYDDKGNLIRRVDARGNAVDMEYDANGNQILQRDALGNTVTRTYDPLLNTLLTETTYQVADPDGAGPGEPGKSMTARYVYDAAGHLRFQISAEGSVIEHRYNAAGERFFSMWYTTYAYDLRAFGIAAAPSEAEAARLMNDTDKSTAVRHDYEYDSRGLLATEWRYDNLTPGGNGDPGSPIMRYVHDQSGQLLQTIDGTDKVTSFVHDGMGRLLSTTDFLGNVTLNSYDAGGSRITIRLPSGLSSTSVYNREGELTDVISSGPAGEELGRTSYAYDADGRLRMTTGPTGERSHILYDEAGRKAADISVSGIMTEYRYDDNGQMTQTLVYENVVSVLDLGRLVEADGKPLSATLAQASIRPAASELDQHEWRWYDAAGRQQKTVDTAGLVTDYEYDGASRLVRTVIRANTVDITSLPADPGMQDAVVPASTNDRMVLRTYDADGQLRFEVDADRYLTMYSYDNAGQQVRSTRFGRRMPAGAVAGEFTPARHAADITIETVYDARGAVLMHFDGIGQQTYYVYDAAGRLTETIRSIYVPDAQGIPPDEYEGDGTLIVNNPDGGRTFYVTTEGKTAIYVLNARGQTTSETLTTSGLDALGQSLPIVNRFGFDVLGRTLYSVKAQGLLAQESTEAIFDSAKTLQHVIVTSNGKRTVYDAFRKIISIENSLSYTATFHNDGSRTIISQTDSNTTYRCTIRREC